MVSWLPWGKFLLVADCVKVEDDAHGFLFRDFVTSNGQFGLLDNWLRAIKDLYYIHQHQLEPIADMNARADLLCELNVARSVENVCHTSIVQNAWNRGQNLSVHGT